MKAVGPLLKYITIIGRNVILKLGKGRLETQGLSQSPRQSQIPRTVIFSRPKTGHVSPRTGRFHDEPPLE